MRGRPRSLRACRGLCRQVARAKFDPVRGGPAAASGKGASAAADAFSQLLRGEAVDQVHVDLGERLKEISLAELPCAVWPRCAKGGALATEIKRLKTKRGLANPFVYVDLRQWIPAAATGATEDESAGAGSAGAKPQLSWTQWHLAIDG